MLRFQHEATPPIEVDEIGGARAVEFRIDDGLIDYIGIRTLICLAGFRTRQVKIIAKLRKEQRIVCPLGG